MSYTWRSEDSFQELLISFYHVGFGNETEVGTLDNKHLYFLQPSPGTLMDTVVGYKKPYVAFCRHHFTDTDEARLDQSNVFYS